MYGLDVCDPCRTLPGPRVTAWATLHVEERWETHRNNSSTPVQIISAIARSTVRLPTVSFSFEELGWLRRLFTREVQVGDPLFDDAVWISTNDHEATARLLACEGVQSAVLDAVTMRGALDLRDDGVRIRRSGSDPRVPGELGVLVASILHHARRIG